MESAKINPTPIFDTLRFLGKDLRLNLFILKKLQNQSLKIKQDELHVRKKINQIKMRIQRELDTHSDVIQKYTDIQ